MKRLALLTAAFLVIGLAGPSVLADEPTDSAKTSGEKTKEPKAETTPAKEEPAADKPAPEQPAAEQPAEAQAAEDQPTGEQPAEDQPAKEEPPSEQPAAEQPAEEQPAEEKPVEETVEEPVQEDTESAPSVPYEEEETPEKPKRSLFVITYNMALPLGSSRDFVEEFSFEGVGFEYRFLIRPDVSVGALFAWNTFEQRERDNFEFGTMTLTGKRAKIMDMMPLYVTGHYYFVKKGRKVVPFGGINMGAMYSSRIIDYAWWFEKETAWHFAFAPEVGVVLQNLPVPLYLGVKFNYAVKSGDVEDNAFLNFNLGISWAR